MDNSNPYSVRVPANEGQTSCESQISEDGFPVLFERGKNHGLAMAASWIGGGLMLMMGGLMFLVHLFLIPGNDPISLNLTATMPIVMGLFAMLNGRSLSKAPHAVRLWQQGIEIDAKQPSRLAWDDIHRVAVEDGYGGLLKVMKLMDADDQPLHQISGLDKFDQLIEQVKSFVQEDGAESESTTATDVHRKRGFKRAIGFAVVGLLMLLGSGFMFYQAWWTNLSNQRMASDAVLGKGMVVERKVAPNGTTKRLYVKVTGEDGSEETHNFEVTSTTFDSVVEGGDVNVRFVPDEPGMAELASGQIKQDGFTDSPAGHLLVAIGLGVFSLFFLVTTVLSWKGYDIKAEKGKMRLVPIGE